MAQLYVPLFMLLILVASCSTVLFHIESDPLVASCADAWRAAGIPSNFLASRPDGVQWDCAMCDLAAGGVNASHECVTCRGFPPSMPECIGIRWAQTFVSIPHAMWFVLVTVTTVGYGDQTPETWCGHAPPRRPSGSV